MRAAFSVLLPARQQTDVGAAGSAPRIRHTVSDSSGDATQRRYSAHIQHGNDGTGSVALRGYERLYSHVNVDVHHRLLLQLVGSHHVLHPLSGAEQRLLLTVPTAQLDAALGLPALSEHHTEHSSQLNQYGCALMRVDTAVHPCVAVVAQYDPLVRIL